MPFLSKSRIRASWQKRMISTWHSNHIRSVKTLCYLPQQREAYLGRKGKAEPWKLSGSNISQLQNFSLSSYQSPLNIFLPLFSFPSYNMGSRCWSGLFWKALQDLESVGGGDETLFLSRARVGNSKARSGFQKAYSEKPIKAEPWKLLAAVAELLPSRHHSRVSFFYSLGRGSLHWPSPKETGGQHWK